MNFSDNLVNKVNTIVKYSKVIIQDIEEQYELKGVVGDLIKNPGIVKVLSIYDDESVEVLLFNNFEPGISVFEEEDKIIEVNRCKFECPLYINWSISNNQITYICDKKTRIKIIPLIEEMCTFDIEEQKNNDVNKYYYTISIDIDLTQITESMYIPCEVYLQVEDRIEDEITSELCIQVNVSASPQGV